MTSAKPIKVLLDFGATGKHHSLYDELLQAPPAGITYSTPSIAVGRDSLARKAYRTARSALGRFVNLDKFARRAARSRAPDCDIVQFANSIDRSPKPFVSDFEHSLSFLGRYPKTARDSWIPQVRKRVLSIMESDNCKFLLPWTAEGAKSLFEAFPSLQVESKTQVLPLAIRVPAEHEPIEHDKFRLLFLGTSNLAGDWNFYYRGGVRMLRVFSKFAKGKDDVELVLTGEVPSSQKHLLSKIPQARTTGLMSKPDLENLFRTSDALFYPSYSTPGLAFLEAMRYHLPIVTTDSWANSEIVAHNKSGFVSKFTRFETHGVFNILPREEDFTAFELNNADEELEESLLENLETIYSSPKKRRAMGEAGFEMVSDNGPFSISRRNARLRKIYDECLS